MAVEPATYTAFGNAGSGHIVCAKALPGVAIAATAAPALAHAIHLFFLISKASSAARRVQELRAPVGTGVRGVYCVPISPWRRRRDFCVSILRPCEGGWESERSDRSWMRDREGVPRRELTGMPWWTREDGRSRGPCDGRHGSNCDGWPPGGRDPTHGTYAACLRFAPLGQSYQSPKQQQHGQHGHLVASCGSPGRWRRGWCLDKDATAGGRRSSDERRVPAHGDPSP